MIDLSRSSREVFPVVRSNRGLIDETTARHRSFMCEPILELLRFDGKRRAEDRVAIKNANRFRMLNLDDGANFIGHGDST